MPAKFPNEAVPVLAVLLAAVALAGPPLFKKHAYIKGVATSASVNHASIKIETDPRVINQALSGCSGSSKAQAKLLLDSQSKACDVVIQNVEQRADDAQAQAASWERQVQVLNAQREAEAEDKRVHLMMMVGLTVAIAVLVVFTLRSKTMPEWAKDITKTAAGAVIAAWFNHG